MSDSPHNQLNTKIEFLHQENQQLRNTIDDLQTVIKLNKQSMRAMIEQDVKIPNQQSTIRDNDNSAKALKLVINEQQKEIDYLMQSLEKVQKERDFAQGKALINEEITYAAEKSEKLLISQLESNINDLNQTIQKQSQRIQQLEKITDQKEDLTGVVIKYRDIIHPNSASILLHEEMETFHQLTVKLQLQINYMKSLQVKLVTMLHKLLSDIQNYLLENNVDLEAVHEQVQGEFLKLLELVQNSKFLSIEINTKQQSNGIGSPMNTDVIGSPILSPFPNKAPQIFKSQNLNQTYDGIQDDRKKVVPKLNLNKAFQIQQINAKRSTQQVKMTEDQLQTKMKKLEQEIEDAKKCVHREMLLAKHFEVENETLKRYIKQLEANNDILVKSNMNFQQKWQKIQQSFMFYKTFFVEHKDQFSQLQMLVQSEKEVSEFQYQKVNVFEDIDQMNFNSARLHNKKDTIRKRAINDISLISYNYNMGNDMSSLMDVEKALHRNQSYTQHRGMVTESIVDQSAVDYDLGNACMERCDSGSSNRGGSVKSQWKEQCKREWTYLATQVHQSKSKDIAQHVKGTIPIQKLTNIQK